VVGRDDGVFLLLLKMPSEWKICGLLLGWLLMPCHQHYCLSIVQVDLTANMGQQQQQLAQAGPAHWELVTAEYYTVVTDWIPESWADTFGTFPSMYGVALEHILSLLHGTSGGKVAVWGS
jgi:hypothetical protein